MKYCAVYLAMAVFLIIDVNGEAQQKVELLKPQTAAPTFSLPSLNGDRISLRTYCGDTLLKSYVNKIHYTVVLSFWATYCIPCRKEIPELMKFQEKHSTDSIKVLCLNIDKEGASVVEPFVKKEGYTLPVLLDPYKKTAERYGVTQLPALFVIDPHGTIQYSSIGYDEKSTLDGKLEQIIADIKSGNKVSVSSSVHLGSSVSVKDDTAGEKTPPELKSKAPIKPEQRWRAVVSVECGNPVEKVADSLGVKPEDVRKWYEDIKKEAISLWGSGKQ